MKLSSLLLSLTLGTAIQPSVSALAPRSPSSPRASLKKSVLSLYISQALSQKSPASDALLKKPRYSHAFRRYSTPALLVPDVQEAAASALVAPKPIKSFAWAVVGAGLGGILAINFLIENNIDLASIAWIDPAFNVGALGEHYRHVPGNLSTQQWITAMEQCKHIQRCPCEPIQFLKRHQLNGFYELDIIVKPLQSITDWLRTYIPNFLGSVIDMKKEGQGWLLELPDVTIHAHKVILATGSHPRTLPVTYGCKKVIDFSTALNRKKLAQEIKPDDVVVVVGSAHSAVVALKFLSELPVQQIIHLYKRPFEYVIQTKKGIINAESGLKGPAAEFARTVLEHNLPANMIRIKDTEQTRSMIIPHCTKIIYAVGFEQNELPWMQDKRIRYNDTAGVIDKNLYGFGIAFPEKKVDAAGKIEHRVGMPYFVEYAKRVIPQWIRE